MLSRLFLFLILNVLFSPSAYTSNNLWSRLSQSKWNVKAGAGSLADGDPDPNVIFPMVSTPLGQLRGETMYSRAGKMYYAYRGIPYAKPPTRFEASEIVEPWEGLLDARVDGAHCPQSDITGAVIGKENCLFLNIYFPHHDRCQSETESGRLPVYFHIHGGSYTSGAGSIYGSKYLLDECIVFVAINYRMGALGFLTTGDDVIPGNLGLKDQVVALNWVKEYISYFRGDPDLVNINGISAGASAVSHLITSPMAAGLFTSAIASSGSALNCWSIQENPLKYANQLGKKLLCSTTTSADLKACLQKIPLAYIIVNQKNGADVAFGPTIEPVTATAPFQTANPAVLLRNGDFNRVPLLTGFVQEEGININAGIILSDPGLTSLLNNYWSELAPIMFFYDDLGLDQEEKDRVSAEIRQFYFGNQNIGLETRQGLVELYNDRAFFQGIVENVELHSKFAPVYSYVMTYKGGASISTIVGYEIPVISHGEDGQFLYYPLANYGFPESTIGTEQFEFSRKIIKYWTQFAKTGQAPVSTFGIFIFSQPSMEVGPNSWNATTGDYYHQLDIVEEEFVNYLTERQTFWRNLGLYDYEYN